MDATVDMWKLTWASNGLTKEPSHVASISDVPFVRLVAVILNLVGIKAYNGIVGFSCL